MNIIHNRPLVTSVASLALIAGAAVTGLAAANASTGSGTASQGEHREVKIKGSISLPESAHEQGDAAEAAHLTKLATVDQKTANAAARATIPGGSVVDTNLGEEDGSVVYDVSVKDPSGATSEVIVDAGNAKVLASETEANDGLEGTAGPEAKKDGSDGETNDAPPAGSNATNGK